MQHKYTYAPLIPGSANLTAMTPHSVRTPAASLPNVSQQNDAPCLAVDVIHKIHKMHMMHMHLHNAHQ